MKKLNILIMFALLSFSTLAQIQGEIIVEGKSLVKVAPEQYTFDLRISVEDKDYTKTTNLALERTAKIIKEFTKNGIDKASIKTLNYSIREVKEYDHKQNKSVFKGYKAEIPIRIKTRSNYEKNDVIFEIIKTNFQADFNLNFSLTPEQTEAIKEKLITLAIADAKQKAEAIAKGTETKLGYISKVEYGEPSTIGQYSNAGYGLRKEQAMSMSDAPAISDVLNPDEVKMQTKIIVVWKIQR